MIIIGKTVIDIVKGDITHVTGISAIVNSTNSALSPTSGVSKQIFDAAGSLLMVECSHLSGCEEGMAVINLI